MRRAASTSKISRQLQQQSIADELHRIARKKFPWRKIKVYGLNDAWGMDLLEMKSYQSQNKHFRYIIVVVDILSKFIYCEPIKKKDATSVHDALARILRKNKPKLIWSDQGKEFFNAKGKELLSRNGIKLYHTFSKIKCSPAEISNKIIKSRLVKYFSANRTKK